MRTTTNGENTMKTKILFILLFAMLASSCTKVTIHPRKFYILEYKQINEKHELFNSEPYHFSVRIPDAEVSSTYNRRQIVIRASENQIRYDFENLWADRLPNATANLIHHRISRYNFFENVTRDFNQQAKYEILLVVNALEYQKTGHTFAARLNINVQFKRTLDNFTVFQHNADRTRQIHVDDIEMFIQTINDILMEETDIFLLSINRYIQKIDDNYDIANKRVFSSRSFFEVLPEERPYTMHEIDADDTFYGRLMVPSKTEPELEPLYVVEDEEQNHIGSHQMGTDVHLPPGKYILFLGNGTISQRVVEEVEIFPRYKTVLEPDLGWLTINIIDSNRNQIDNRYELFNLSNAESFGFGYGIKEGVGQQLDCWVLRPGHYKIVLNGLPFNTYSDFATVEVKKGELEQFTIVVEEGTNRLIGAGRMFYEELISTNDNIRISIINHLNANINSKNDMEKNKNSVSFTVIEQLDTRILYDSGPFHYTMNNLIEIGISKDHEMDARVSSDKFDFKNTFVYFFIRDFGLYARADVSSHMFSEYVQTRDVKHYKRIDVNGVETIEDTNRFKTKDALYPIIFKEGLGLNYRVLNYSRANLNLRAGLGYRQDINNRVFNFEGNSNGFDVYRELESVYQRGTEFSANGNFQILRNLNYTTIADLLIPFDSNRSESYEWENILNLRMFKYISWDYRLTLSYNSNIRDYAMLDHALFLRFTYAFVR